MEKFKPVYDMTPEEIEESNRNAIEKQQELLQKMSSRRTDGPVNTNEDVTLVITPLMRKEALLREDDLSASLPDKE